MAEMTAEQAAEYRAQLAAYDAAEAAKARTALDQKFGPFDDVIRGEHYQQTLTQLKTKLVDAGELGLSERALYSNIETAIMALTNLQNTLGTRYTRSTPAPTPIEATPSEE